MKSLPTSLREILASPEVFKVGVGISEDRTRLLQDWSLDLVTYPMSIILAVGGISAAMAGKWQIKVTLY